MLLVPSGGAWSGLVSHRKSVSSKTSWEAGVDGVVVEEEEVLDDDDAGFADEDEVAASMSTAAAGSVGRSTWSISARIDAGISGGGPASLL